MEALMRSKWHLIIGVLRDSWGWDICLWLRRNGIDPREVPHDAEITIQYGRIFYERWDFTTMEPLGVFPVRDLLDVPMLVPPPKGGFRR